MVDLHRPVRTPQQLRHGFPLLAPAAHDRLAGDQARGHDRGVGAERERDGFRGRRVGEEGGEHEAECGDRCGGARDQRGHGEGRGFDEDGGGVEEGEGGGGWEVNALASGSRDGVVDNERVGARRINVVIKSDAFHSRYCSLSKQASSCHQGPFLSKFVVAALTNGSRHGVLDNERVGARRINVVIKQALSV